jgi:hypothetical protein
VIASRALAWFLLCVWAVWLVALQSLAASPTGPGRFVPELALVLALSVLSRADARDLPWLVLAVALARGAYAVDPLPAVLVGAAGALMLALAVRSMIETTGIVLRTLIAGACVYVFDLWLIAVHELEGTRAAGASLGDAFGDAFGARALDPWPAALASAACALVLGGVLARLPGLTPLRRRPW